MKKSPYLANPRRLSDVIAAIQLMGTFKYASRTVEKWNETIGRKPLSESNWMVVFEQHPEFFLLKRNYASLIWRRSREKNYDTINGKEINMIDVKKLTDEEKKKFSRKPLNSKQIQTLINAAVQMHTAAISQQKDKRWWIPMLASLMGVIIGFLLKLFSSS